MPEVCAHCKEIGHSIRRCKLAPKSYSACKCPGHSLENCPKNRKVDPLVKKQKPPPPKTPSKPTHIYVQKAGPPVPLLASNVILAPHENETILEEGECSQPVVLQDLHDSKFNGGLDIGSLSSSIEPDSSDVSSPEKDDDYDDEYGGYTKVLSKRQQKLLRGKGPKNL